MFDPGSRRSDRDAVVDLSFSQILEAHSWQQQQQQRRRKPRPSSSAFVSGGGGGTTAGLNPPRQPGSNGRSAPLRHHAVGTSLHALEETEEDDREDRDATADRPYPGPRMAMEHSGYRTRSDTEGEPTDDEDWTGGAVPMSNGRGGGGGDVYRFVQPRRLSSWVQDDAVNACFKCHTLFTLLLRKHHCRACGRIFCSTCSSQRVVIPGDYESTPVAPSSNMLTSNASELIGSISWYMWSSPSSTTAAEDTTSSLGVDGSLHLTAEERQERFLRDVQRLQQSNVISKFTPCRTRSGSASVAAVSSSKSAYVPDGSVLQRVCDDCACALQQRRQHYNIVKVFELCEFNLKELRVLGQVCRKWHRASIMCLSMFRQIQYYLPTHRLSEREKSLLVINRKFLCGHTKWILQLIKAIDFSHESEDEGHQGMPHQTLAAEVLDLIQQPRQQKCMLTMCSRLCQPEMKSVDALEILADQSIRNVRLRAMCVDALLKTATEDEWGSFLPVLLHSLSVEPDASGSKLGRTLVRQAQCDVNFCYDFYWGLTVMAEDSSCRRKFDGIKQRLLLTLAQLRSNTSTRRLLEDESNGGINDIAEQLLRGQEFVDLFWKIPPRIPVAEVRQLLENYITRSSLFAQPADDTTSSVLLRLPVDPTVKVSGINFNTIEVKKSAEAPMIVTCVGVQRDEDEGVDRDRTILPSGDHPSPPRSARRAKRLPYYRIMYKRDDLRKDAIVQNIINVMYFILKQETRLDIPLVTYRVLPTSSFDGLIEIVENAHTLYSIIRDHGSILNFLHHYNGHRTLSEISTSFRESLAAYTVITFLLGVGDRHADNVMLTKDGILFHIDYGFILGKDPKPLQPPMRLDHYMIEALGGTQTAQFEQFKKLCVIAFNCLRRHVSLFMIMLTLVVKALPEITDFDMNYTQSDLEAFVVERFLPGQTDDEAATALMLRMEGKLNEKIGLKLSDFVHAHANEKTVSKSIGSVGSSMKVGVEAVSTVANSISSSASSLYNYVWGGSS